MVGDKEKYSSESSSSRFMAAVSDDLLLEILILLPRLGSAITVCKSWHSLIISDHPNAFLRHTLHHHYRRQNCDPDPLYTPPCTLLLGNRSTEPCLRVLSEKSTIIDTALSRQSAKQSLLGFVSDLNCEAIKASFNDSLLLHLNGEYSIYKPVTQEQLLIPNPPSANDSRFLKLMLVGSEELNGIFQFRVVKFLFSANNSVMVFSSETGQWNESVLKFYPECSWYQMVAAGGALHWQKKRSAICVYNPFCEANDPRSCRIVKFPSGFIRTAPYNISIRLGAVRGRFRLSQMFSDNKLIIWELKKKGNGELKKNGNGDDQWRLVHEVSLRIEMNREITTVVALHPEDGDVIFVSCGLSIYQYQLKDGERERFPKVAEVSDPDPRYDEILHIFLKVFSLVHF